jgi:hypothetical protein
MKADRERFETARARLAHWVGNDPLWRLGRSFPGGDRKSHEVPSPLGPCTDSRWSNYFQKEVGSLRQGDVSDRPGKAGKEKKKTLLR